MEPSEIKPLRVKYAFEFLAPRPSTHKKLCHKCFTASLWLKTVVSLHVIPTSLYDILNVLATKQRLQGVDSQFAWHHFQGPEKDNCISEKCQNNFKLEFSWLQVDG